MANADVAYQFDAYRLVPSRRLLTRGDGSEVRLRGKAFDALVFLVEHAGEAVEREALIAAIWPKRVVEDNNLNQTIAALRRCLGEHHIITLPGRGYQFVTPVRRGDDVRVERAAPVVSSPAPPQIAAWAALAAATVATVAVTTLVASDVFSTRPPATLVGAAVTVQPLTTYPGEETTPALAPDGNRVAFSWRPPAGERRIYVTQIGGGEPQRLSGGEGGDDAFPAWSPDGQSIAFMRFRDPAHFDVLVMPALGGLHRKLTSGTRWPISKEGSPLLAWSPDSEYLLFTTLRAGESEGGSYSLRRLSLKTGHGDELDLDIDPTDYDTSPAVSSDGRWLAFTRFTGAQRLNEVLIQRLGPDLVPEGAPTHVADLPPDVYHSLHWGPGGDRLWLATTNRIFEWQRGRTPEVIHTLGPQFTNSTMTVALRGDGARVAVTMHRDDMSIFALALDPVTKEPRGTPTVRVPSAAIDYHPQVSPDGRSLAFVSDRGGSRDLWLASLDGSKPRRLTNVGQLIVGYPRWSPDGKTLSFHSSAPREDRVIYRVDTESGVTQRLFNGCCPGGWSADGRSLYVTELGTENHIARVDLATGSRERLFVGDVAAESTDGRYLLYGKAKEPGYFRRPLVDGAVGEETRLVDDYLVGNGGLAPVADGFFYIGFAEDGTPRALRFYDYATGEPRDIYPVPPKIGIGVSATPDASQVFYSTTSTEPAADIDVIDFVVGE